MSRDVFHTHKRANNFTIIDNLLIDSSKLSWAAKGVLIYLLSKPDGWKVYRADIVQHATNGIDSVKSILQELRKAGYITLTRISNCKGKVIAWRYDVYDEPVENPVEKYTAVRLVANDPELMARYAEYYGEDSEEESVLQDTASEAALLEEKSDGDGIGSPEVDNPLLDENYLPENQKRVTHMWQNHNLENPPYSNIEYSKTDNNNTQSILSKDAETTDKMDGSSVSMYEEVVRQLKENVEFKLLGNQPKYINWLEEWIYVVAEQLASNDDYVLINGGEIPKRVVRDRMLARLEHHHFEKVKDNIASVQSPIRNMRKYIFVSLYSSLNTLDDEIENDVACMNT